MSDECEHFWVAVPDEGEYLEVCAHCETERINYFKVRLRELQDEAFSISARRAIRESRGNTRF